MVYSVDMGYTVDMVYTVYHQNFMKEQSLPTSSSKNILIIKLPLIIQFIYTFYPFRVHIQNFSEHGELFLKTAYQGSVEGDY